MQANEHIERSRHKFGAHIRAMREAQGISQAKFSAKIGLSRTYYNGIEQGYRNVSFDNALRIAQGLGVPLALLTEGVDT